MQDDTTTPTTPMPVLPPMDEDTGVQPATVPADTSAMDHEGMEQDPVTGEWKPKQQPAAPMGDGMGNGMPVPETGENMGEEMPDDPQVM